MIIWSIQHEKMVEKLLKNNFITSDTTFVCEYFKVPYSFLIKKMLDKNIKRDNISYPLWGWYKYNEDTFKPDLRCSCHLPKGEIGYRLEIEIDDKDVLLSDFELWHFVLNNWYLPDDLEDGDIKENVSTEEKEKSWDKVFDISKSSHIQATFWKLEKNMVKDIKRFKAR